MLAGPVGVSLRDDLPPAPEVAAFIACLRRAAEPAGDGGEGARRA